MSNSLTIRSEASQVLNFLIYLQNIYLNQSCTEPREYKFPYQSTLLPIEFAEDFNTQFKKVWDQTAHKAARNTMNHVKLLHAEKETMYETFFVRSEQNAVAYEEIYRSYSVWRASWAGGFSLERATDEREEDLYKDLVAFLKEAEHDGWDLNIAILYDENVLGSDCVTKDFLTLSVKDFYFNYAEVFEKVKRLFLE